MRVAVLTGLVIAVTTAASIGFGYAVHGNLNAYYGLLSLFFCINLPICYWEICLFLRRDAVERRADYWRARRGKTGRTPAVEFLLSEIPLSKALSPTVWADVWATYSMYDESYADRRTFGFNADIANGFFTPIPALVLHATFAVGFLPALLAGILGVMLFWQWTYVTSVYLVSFFVARRHKQIARGDLWLYLWGTNSPWVLFALLGLYVSVRLIVDGDYGVLGHR